MRDHCLHPAQTNLELYARAIARGLRHWPDFASAPAQLARLRTGWLSSVDLSDDASEPGA